MRNIKKIRLHILYVLWLLIMIGGKITSQAAEYAPIQLQVPYFPQKISGDCGISSISMIEAYANGCEVSDYDWIYEEVYQANNRSLYINEACSNGKYRDIEISLSSFYNELKKGNPVLIYRQPYNHWSVIVGYNGSRDYLEESGFIVWDTKHGVNACNYDQVTGGRQFNLERWKKAPNWNGSQYVDQGNTNIVRARVREIGIVRCIIYPSPIFTENDVRNITDTSAFITTTVPYQKYTEFGFYLGTDWNTVLNTTPKRETSTSSVKYISYKLGTLYDGVYKWSDPLIPGTTYYYAMYAKIGKVTHISPIFSFRTSGNYSDWMETLPSGVFPEAGYQIESKMQYRTRILNRVAVGGDRKDEYLNAGYALQEISGDTGAWSDWSRNEIYPSENSMGRTEVETRGGTEQSQSYQEWEYYRYTYVNKNNGRTYWTYSRSGAAAYCNSQGYRRETRRYRSYLGNKYVDYDGSWWFDDGLPGNPFTIIVSSGYTEYRSRYTTFYYHLVRWSEWSEWSDTPASANADTDVETRVLYRYR